MLLLFAGRMNLAAFPSINVFAYSCFINTSDLIEISWIAAATHCSALFGLAAAMGGKLSPRRTVRWLLFSLSWSASVFHYC